MTDFDGEARIRALEALIKAEACTSTCRHYLACRAPEVFKGCKYCDRWELDEEIVEIYKGESK